MGSLDAKDMVPQEDEFPPSPPGVPVSFEGLSQEEMKKLENRRK